MTDQTVELRVEALLQAMNLEEKVAQLGSVRVLDLLDEGGLSGEKADRVLKNGIGQITRVAGSPGITSQQALGIANEIQEYLRERTW